MRPADRRTTATILAGHRSPLRLPRVTSEFYSAFDWHECWIIGRTMKLIAMFTLVAALQGCAETEEVWTLDVQRPEGSQCGVHTLMLFLTDHGGGDFEGHVTSTAGTLGVANKDDGYAIEIHDRITTASRSWPRCIACRWRARGPTSSTAARRSRETAVMAASGSPGTG